MSETEQTQNIEITKPKRVYKPRQKKEIVLQEAIPQQGFGSIEKPAPAPLPTPEPVLVKRACSDDLPVQEKLSPKRVYRPRKSKDCLTNPQDSPQDSPQDFSTQPEPEKRHAPVGTSPMGQKKERTPKQMEAFLKMQEARLTKQQEVKMLKKIEKEKARLEEEEYKIDELIKQRMGQSYHQAQPAQVYQHAPVGTSQMGQSIPSRQVSNQPKYLFL